MGLDAQASAGSGEIRAEAAANLQAVITRRLLPETATRAMLLEPGVCCQIWRWAERHLEMNAAKDADRPTDFSGS